MLFLITDDLCWDQFGPLEDELDVPQQLHLLHDFRFLVVLQLHGILDGFSLLPPTLQVVLQQLDVLLDVREHHHQFHAMLVRDMQFKAGTLMERHLVQRGERLDAGYPTILDIYLCDVVLSHESIDQLNTSDVNGYLILRVAILDQEVQVGQVVSVVHHTCRIDIEV